MPDGLNSITCAEENKKLDFSFEQELWAQGYKLVAGVDEAGRGPIAGPVVAAAVIFPVSSRPPLSISGINDSKKLTPFRRESLFEEIKRNACSVGIGVVDNELIDRTDILEATMLAMREAIFNLEIPPDYILVDGLHIPFPQECPVPQRAMIKGDSLVFSIAAASIIAKVYRDRIMDFLGKNYSQYRFEKHKGYPTKEHIRILEKFGPCPIHRHSFKPVKNLKESVKH